MYYKYTSQKEAFLQTMKNANEAIMGEKFVFDKGGAQFPVFREWVGENWSPPAPKTNFSPIMDSWAFFFVFKNASFCEVYL